MSDEVRGWLSPKAVAAEAGVSQEFDLSQCVREPIHLLGGVQSYGALVAARPHDAVVDTVSRNTDELLGRAAAELVGRPVTELIGEEQWALVLESMEAAAGLRPGRGLRPGPGGSAAAAAPASGGSAAAAAPAAGDSAAASPGGPAASGVLALSLESDDGRVRPFDVTVHRVAELLVLEFEPRAADGLFVFQNFYPRVRRALHRLQGAADVTERPARPPSARSRRSPATTGWWPTCSTAPTDPARSSRKRVTKGGSRGSGCGSPQATSRRRPAASTPATGSGSSVTWTTRRWGCSRSSGRGRANRSTCRARYSVPSPATTWSICATSVWPRPCRSRSCTTVNCGA
ncbi:hypothetical protein SMICM17S_07997 [Streptomyces microflavus]